jgi:thiosulfate/3-mercaptopyruvate sulfurtransferase
MKHGGGSTPRDPPHTKPRRLDPPAPPLVSAEWLAERLDAPNLVVVDAHVEKAALPSGGFIRRPARAAFERNGHIPGARFADMLKDFSDASAPFPFTRPSARRLEAAAGALGLSSQSRIVVYDRANGIWAARLWWLLRAYGHDEISVLDGGFKAWTQENRPLSFGDAPVAAASFAARSREGFFVDKAEVVAVMEGRAPGRLVCVLRPSVFGGAEKAYARAGHIPGSLNVPYVDLIDESTNLLRPRASLRASFSPALSRHERVILYCGGGVTAAGSALALTRLGLPDIAVYDGSLNEWAADPALPLRTEPA